MDDDGDDLRIAAMRQYAAQASGSRADDRGPVPRRGRNKEFDRYVRDTFGEIDPEQADEAELRRAAWLTWKTAAPSVGPSRGSSRGSMSEDEELARALAMSVEEHKASRGASRAGSNPASPIVIDDDDDDDLKAALALSEAESKNPAPVVDRKRREETPEEERKMLEEVLAASLVEAEKEKAKPLPASEADDLDANIEAANAAFQAEREASREQQRREREAKRLKTEHSSAPPTSVSASSSSKAASSGVPTPVEPAAAGGLKLGGLMIDRAQLEKERLARQAAKEGKPLPDVVSPNAAASSSKAPVPPSQHQQPAASHNVPGPSSTPTRYPNHPLQTASAPPHDAAGEYFLDGELRHVALRIGNSSTGRTFSPRQVFGDTSQMKLIILSSFVWDEEWITTFLPAPEEVPTIRICRPPGNDFERLNKSGKLQPMETGEVLCYPRMDGKRGSEHMKFAWIFYKTGRLRVAVMTANMVDYDWEQIENTIFVQDFLPNKSLGSNGKGKELPDFPTQFAWLFAHLKLPKALRFLSENHPFGSGIPIKHSDESFSDLGKYDWSRVQVRVVMSVAGVYTGFGKMVQFGSCRLGKVIAEEGWTPPKGERVVAEYQGSSLGSYSTDWMNNFYQTISGHSLDHISRQPKATGWPSIKVIFPSLATVDASRNGRNGGGTMFSGKSYSDKTSSLFHDANSKRGGVLMHTKMLIGLFEPSSSLFSPGKGSKRKADELEDDNASCGGWIYVGSHNFSPSAWGTVNYKNKPPTLNISNYELGIVFPLPRANASVIADTIAAHKRPAPPYGKNDVPWSQDQHMPR
ncbi:hypothetical protein Q8F55_000624 [Vanrija albida]|uniref:PLD phosphodiesterase domain-containing protein n=1 Tax=Vanrija albida TaxID=181172 RepID=A0ABR3QDT0_9TREE